MDGGAGRGHDRDRLDRRLAAAATGPAPWRRWSRPLLTAPMLWLHPVSDGIRFGQVNAFMVLACLMDLRRRGRLLRGPAGVLDRPGHGDQADARRVRLHYFASPAGGARPAAPSARRGRRRRSATLLLLPEASFAFWGGALQDPNRLGPNGGTSNQSIRGFLLRVGPHGAAGTVLWLLLVGRGPVGRVRGRPAGLRRAASSLSEVAAVGLVAVLLSPVAWIHHLPWMVVVIPALIGDGRDRRRWAVRRAW